MFQRLPEDIQPILWEKAGKHYCGGGLEGGVDFHSASLLLARLRSKAKPAQAGVLLNVLTAGYWTAQRRHECGLERSDICDRCHGAVETPLHRFYQCPCNSDISSADQQRAEEAEDQEDEDELRPKGLQARLARDPVGETAHLQQDAETDLQAGRFEGFWLRGMIPSAWTIIPLPEKRAKFATGEQKVEAHAGKISLYLDGSGSHADPRLRRCGWAVVWLRWHPNDALPRFSGAWFGHLGRELHTVPRSEIMALYMATMKAEPGWGPVECWSDCSYVVNTFAQIMSDPHFEIHKAKHSGLWIRIKERVDALGLSFTVSKCKAHTDSVEQQLKHRQEAHVSIGNECADALAKRGAALCQDEAAIASLKKVEATAAMIRARLARIQSQILEVHGPELDGAGEEVRLRNKASRRTRNKRKRSEAQLEERAEEEPEEPPLHEPFVLEVGEAPVPTRWDQVKPRVHLSHRTFVNTPSHWVCARCASQVAKQGQIRISGLARPCLPASKGGLAKLRALHKVGSPYTSLQDVR